MKSVDICVVLPAKDEAITIQQTVLRFHNELPQGYILVVDNNSSDDTAKIAEKTLAINNIAGAVLKEIKPGKGNAVNLAFESIDAEAYVVCDADLTYPIESVNELLTPVLNEQADLVIGDRIAGGLYQKATPRRFHYLGNIVLSWLVWIFYGQRIGDVSSGFRAMNRNFVNNYTIGVDGLELEADMLTHAINAEYSIQSVAIEYYSRPTGSTSKLNTMSDGWRYVKVILFNSKRFHWIAISSCLFLMLSFYLHCF